MYLNMHDSQKGEKLCNDISLFHLMLHHLLSKH